VFNVAQIDGLDNGQCVEHGKNTFTDATMQFIDATKADIRIGGDRACYIPSQDYICLPPEQAFTGREHYLAIALHDSNVRALSFHRIEKFTCMRTHQPSRLGTQLHQRQPPYMLYFPHMAAKEATLNELGEMLTHVIQHMATKDEIADLKTEMMDRFQRVDKQFGVANDRLRDLSSEIAVIHRRIERLEEQGASAAGFAKEIDHALERIAAIEKHLGLDKNLAA
jgi:antirestriction protein ArdC